MPTLRPLALLTLSAAFAAPPARGEALTLGFDDVPAALTAAAVAGGGADGDFARFDGNNAGGTLPLSEPVGPGFGVGVAVRVAGFSENGNAKGFGPTTPPTLLALTAENGDDVVNLRVRTGKAEVAVRTTASAFVTVMAPDPLPLNEWVRVEASHDGAKLRLLVNGDEVAAKNCPPPVAPAVAAEVGSWGKRRLVGDLDELVVVNGPLPRAAADAPAGPGKIKPLPPIVDGERILQTKPDAVFPLAEGLSAQAEFVDFGGTNGGAGTPALLVRSFGHNGETALWSGGRYDASSGTLTYTERTAAADAPWGADLAGGPWFSVDGAGGRSELVSSGTGTGFGKNELVAYPQKGDGRSARIDPPYALRFDGSPLAALAPEVPGSAQPCALTDLDGDGTPDFLFAKIDKKTWPDGATNPWSRSETKYLGKGRTYSANGVYLGEAQRSEYLWARGTRSGGELSFSGPLPIFQGREDFPLILKGEGPGRATVMTIAGERILVIAGDLDGVWALPFTVDGDALRCGEATPLLGGGGKLVDVYLPHHLSVRDLDGDGSDELLVTGNPGSVSLLAGTAVGNFAEHPVLGTGGAVRQQTLILPQRIDFDGDGVQDLVVGDASGFFQVWPGTRDARVYGTPKPLTLDGEPLHWQPGENASMQGPHERRWGYVNPLIVDWDGDGRLDLLFGHTGADLRVARGLGGLAVSAPEAMRNPDGTVWAVAWRQRPAVLPDAADGSKRLLYQDWDGDLAVASFAASEPMVVRAEEKLEYADGGTIPLSGPGGFWGRGKPTVADWDGDGDFDVIYGGHGGNNQYVDSAFEPLKNASAMVFENVGSDAKPVLSRPRLLAVDGEPIQVAKHVGGVWPTDLDGDGQFDLLVGTDDGRVYAFNREELEELPAGSIGTGKAASEAEASDPEP